LLPKEYSIRRNNAQDLLILYRRGKLIANLKIKKKSINKTSQIPFAPILEEETYDNVIVNRIEEDGKEESSGPSYLDALKFATVYNTQTKIHTSSAGIENMIKQKMNKINDYRDRLKMKSEVFSRNIKQNDDSISKNTSSKAGSAGIAGSSTRESQN